MMSKGDVKGVILAAIAGVAAMMLYDKVKKLANRAPIPRGPTVAINTKPPWYKEQTEWEA